ncbi:MAG: ABC transporter ATP-binding protein [candidate division Zixibacteria bacterium]|nr:ABC transporter ATP-binding protein [candidate division Zixibacteria bacterium]
MYRLRADNLSKRFGVRKVFQDISFELTTGQVFIITGPNGSGKTTLLMTLLRQFRPATGTVTFSSDDNILADEELRAQTALVAPYLSLYDALTAEENLNFFITVSGGRVEGQEINRVLNQVGLEGRGSDLVGEYSSGMKQRLKFAIALLRKPGFLFLDEPTSNLDASGKEMVYRIIEQSKQTRIVVIASNEQEDERAATKQIRLT